MDEITQYGRPHRADRGSRQYSPARGKRKGKISIQLLGIYARRILKCFWQLKLNVSGSEQRTMIRSCNGSLRNILVKIPT